MDLLTEQLHKSFPAPGGYVRYKWTTEEITEALLARLNCGDIDTPDIHELVVDLREAGGRIGQQVSKALQRELDRRFEDEDLCPGCWAQTMEHAGFYQEYRGECHGTPAYETMASKLVCPGCGHEENL